MAALGSVIEIGAFAAREPPARRAGRPILCALVAFTQGAHAAKPDTHIRAEIPAELRWDFSAIYRDWPAWEAGMVEMQTKMGAFAQLKGTLAQGPEAGLKVYQAHDEIGQLQYLVYRYPQLQLQRDVDLTQRATVQAAVAQMDALVTRMEAEAAKIR